MAQYVATGYVEAGYYQTGLSIDWLTKVIFVPQFFLTFVSGTTYTLDTNLFRLALRDLEDDEAGITFPPTHNHNTQVVLSGVTYARVIEIINGYTVTFEDGLYAVNLVGSNNNIPDVLNLNQVSVRASNSAGLQNVSTPTNVVTGTALTAEETANAVWLAATRTLTASNDPSAVTIATEVWAKVIEGLSAEEILRVQLAALAGKRQGIGTATEEYLAQDGVTPRITLTPTDANGNGTPILNGAI